MKYFITQDFQFFSTRLMLFLSFEQIIIIFIKIKKNKIYFTLIFY
jgi:hypothetical protein